MKVYIGIDIGKKKCDYCVVRANKRVIEQGQYPNNIKDAEQLADRLMRKYGKCVAACETTGNMWNTTYAAFEKAGIDIKLANTYKMAIIAKTGKKTDKIDAEKIAHVLRMGMIPECYVPSMHIRGLRSLARQRIKIVQDRTRVINRIHSLLDRHNIKIDAVNMYSSKALKQIESTSLEPIHDEIALKQCASQMKFLTSEIAEISTYLDAEAAQNEDARLLASLTGIGPLSALILAVEIGDIKRFATPKKLVSWGGLCPTVHQSGDKLYLGRMKKIDTNDIVNWVMIEAANTAARCDDRMRLVYETSRKRHADKHALAIVVVANKMLTIAWHILTTRTPYQSHNPKLYKDKLATMDKARKNL